MLATAVRTAVRSRPVGRTVVCALQTRALSVKYTPSHEWVKLEGDVVTVGITDFAQKALGDVVYVDLPEPGATFSKGDPFGSVESVKAASDVYAPVSGEIVESNTKLVDDPSAVNKAAESSGWFTKFRIKDKSEFDALLDAAAYKKHTESH